MKDKIDKIYTVLLITVITALLLIVLAVSFLFSPFSTSSEYSAELYYRLLGLFGGIVPFVLGLDALYIHFIFEEQLKNRRLSSFIRIGAIISLIGGALVAVGGGLIWSIGIV